MLGRQCFKNSYKLQKDENYKIELKDLKEMLPGIYIISVSSSVFYKIV